MGRRVKHLARYQEIARVLVKNGFGWFVQGMGLSAVFTHPRHWFGRSTRAERDPISVYARIRHVLEDLGPTFVKVGQVASLRPDLLPQALITELEKLQDQAAPLPMETVQRIVERELKAPLEAVFSSFDPVPIGSASIGQVHRAQLKSGAQVAVKVQRPDIRQRVETDLEILTDLARLAERRFDWAAHYRVSALVSEFAGTVRRELDYLQEARNADRIGRMFAGDQRVWIPSVHWPLCTAHVLVMDFAKGIKLTDPALRDLS
ncbi:MAG: ABC transporter, partial [Alicyclobacillus sp.]|nr:ABC transporter [Alicyclobacillus sp.]